MGYEIHFTYNKPQLPVLLLKHIKHLFHIPKLRLRLACLLKSYIYKGKQAPLQLLLHDAHSQEDNFAAIHCLKASLWLVKAMVNHYLLTDEAYPQASISKAHMQPF